jgi:UDP-N-acetylmuramoylalanine--D-glutamate ligase
VELADLAAAAASDVGVWEVSNRHLRDRPVACDVAVLTNISPNHTEDHGSWDAYVRAKGRLTSAPGPGGHVVLSGTDGPSRNLLDQVRATGATPWHFDLRPDTVPDLVARRDGFSWQDQGSLFVQKPGGTPVQVARAEDLSLPGAHNIVNLLAGLAAVAASGATGLLTEPGRLVPLAGMSGLPERLETFAEQNGVLWIDDIQATTAPAAAAGLKAVGAQGRPTTLIVGGEDKGMDYSGMAEAAIAHACRVLALPGTGTTAFVAALGGRLPVTPFDDLGSLLHHAADRTEAGGVVLLSPGCAFFRREYVGSGPPYKERVRAVLAERPGGAHSPGSHEEPGHD